MKEKLRKRKWRYLAEYVLFRAAVCLLRMLSVRQSVRLAKGLARAVTHLLPAKINRRDVARANLRTAFGDDKADDELDAIIERMWTHLFRMIVEIVQLPRKVRLENIADVIDYRVPTAVLRQFCSGRPVIFLSGHFGNWEMSIATFGLYGFPLGVVARDLDNPYLHEWFRQYREGGRHRLISKKGGSETMLAMLERGGFLAMLGDQDAGSRGLFVDFFGRPASTFKSISLLALQYEALICVGYARRLEDDFRRHRWVRYELNCEDLIDPRAIEADDPVREITQRYTQALERIVHRAPEQYFWVHRRWKSVPRKRGRKRRAA